MSQFETLLKTLQTHHVYSTLKRRGNDRFHVVSTWNTRGVFVGKGLAQGSSCEFCEMFKDNFFTEYLRATSSVKSIAILIQFKSGRLKVTHIDSCLADLDEKFKRFF